MNKLTKEEQKLTSKLSWFLLFAGIFELVGSVYMLTNSDEKGRWAAIAMVLVGVIVVFIAAALLHDHYRSKALSKNS